MTARGWYAGPALAGIFRDAIRACRWSPGVSLGVVATLALALGTNVAMYRVLDRLLLAPPPHVERPGEVGRIYVTQTYGDRTWIQAVMTLPDIQALAKVEAFSNVAAEVQREILFGRGENAHRVKSKIVSGNYFRLLGVAPLRGRFFDDADDRMGAAPVAVLGHRFWRRAFGGSDDALGKELELGLGRFTVVGIAPPGFSGAGLEPVDVYLPLDPTATALYEGSSWQTRNMLWLQAVARLAPGAARQAAEEEAALVLQQDQQQEAGYGPSLVDVGLESLLPARGPNGSPEVAVSRWLGGVSVILLLVACANVANLLLVRGLDRRREVALQLALGCSRLRLASQLVVEGLLLSAAGCLVALGVSIWGGELLRTVLLPHVDWSTMEQAPRIALFAISTTLLVAALVSLLPLLQLMRTDPGRVLKIGGGLGGGAAVRKGLVVLQTALSVVLLIGAGLFVRSLTQVRAVDLGLDMDRLVLLQLEPSQRNLGAAASRELYRLGAARLGLLPEVEAVAIATALPFSSAKAVSLRVAGVDEPPPHQGGGPYVYSVSAAFSTTAGLELRRGRFFTADEEMHGAHVAVVAETMARLYWPGQEPLGHCLHIGADDAPCSEVVGVVEDSRRFSIVEPPSLAYYVPLGTLGDGDAPSALLVRTAPGSSPSILAGRARSEALAAVDGLRAVQARPFDEILDPQRRSWRLGAVLFSLFGGLALVVAAVGLFGILAFEVARRIPELGVRSALGATSAQLASLVVGDALLWGGLGVLVGSALAMAIAPRLADLLFQTSPRDPAVIAFVGIALMLVAVAAALLPARRATKVDPAQALRAE